MTARVTITLEDLMLLRSEARGFSLAHRQPAGSLLAGRHASRLRGRGLDFDELRRYHAGDDIRAIDWKATARLRTPQVRVYREERERPVLLVVDQRAAMFFGSRRAMKSVAAAELTALGAWRALTAGDRVGGLIFNNAEFTEVRPHRSRSRVLQLLHEVARFNARLAEPDRPSGDVTLNDVLQRASQLARHDHLVVIISDLDGANAETEELATELAAHNDVLVAAVYDPLGASLIGAPGMWAADGDRVREIPNSGAFARDFRAAFQRRLDQWRETFRALRVPVLPVTTAEPVADQVRMLFGGRPKTS